LRPSAVVFIPTKRIKHQYGAKENRRQKQEDPEMNYAKTSRSKGFRAKKQVDPKNVDPERN
jgi:hypothetical protein